MQVDKEQSFDQFSHDLTLALEETSRGGSSRWGLRRRTRSTGNLRKLQFTHQLRFNLITSSYSILACPPQPTEDSSSTDANDATNDNNNNDPFALATATNSILSDSDDRQSYAFKLRQKPVGGNFESDSLNENFSPSRPHLRRKRKFKRMAVEYETTPSTPQGVTHPIFPINIIAKKRVIKPSQEFRSNLFFGKRKRPHRERLYEYESFRHSSSVPRQRNGFPYQKECSYLEYKSRNRASSMSMQRSVNSALEKIMPLNKSIVSKIEKISKENQSKLNFSFTPTSYPLQNSTADAPSILNFNFGCTTNTMTTATSQIPYVGGAMTTTTLAQMPNTLNFNETNGGMRFTSSMMTPTSLGESALMMKTNGLINSYKIENKRRIKNSLANQQQQQQNPTALPHHHHHHRKHHKHSRRFQLQFDDQNFMEYEHAMNDSFLSSSSLSSSESETEDTNGSDHEGDDELTDWPGHEAMVNFGKVADLRGLRKSSKLKKIKQDEVLQDDETLMSADEVQFPLMKTPNSSPLLLPSSTNELVIAAKLHSSHPIDINLIEPSHQFSQQDGSSTSGIAEGSFNLPSNFPRVIESEMSGETSNSLLSSSMANEIREIRAGCRRIRDERPGFSIIASFNDELMR